MLKGIKQVDLEGRRVLLRVDFNVPLNGDHVRDTSRIENALPTIRYALAAGARVVLASHLGRPGGKVQPEYSLAPVARVLGDMLDLEVTMATNCIGQQVEGQVAELKPGHVLMLENLRFHPGETANDPDFAEALARLADVYINDAFGTAHRAHASTAGIVDHVHVAVAGLLMQREISALSELLQSPSRPFVAIVGGAKVSDKIGLMTNLLGRLDSVLVGGAMAYTFLKACGHQVGASRVEEDRLDLARELLDHGRRSRVSIELPSDHVAAREFCEQALAQQISTVAIPAGLMGLDIGPATRARYGESISAARTVFWNGPMGVFEWQGFRAGTLAIAEAVADSAARSVVGGGDSVAALALSGRSADITHISTGGGASLKFLEGRVLPGIAALENKGS